MDRIRVLQEIRMQRFEEIHERFMKRRLSETEAAEWLGVSERTFRRQRRRYEDEGLVGLLDRRLGKISPHRVPADEVEAVLTLYRSRYTGWTVKHFHERLVEKHGVTRSYGWTKNVLHARGLVRPALKRSAHRKKRPRRPVPGMMLHQDGSRHLWLPALEGSVDLIVTMDDASSEIYSAFLVEEEGTDSSFRGLLDVFVSRGLACSLYTDRGSHYFHTPEAGGKVDKGHLTQLGRALAQLGVAHIPAGGRRALRADVRHAPGPPGARAGRCRDHDDRGGQPLPRRGLPAASQRPIHGRGQPAGKRVRAGQRRRSERDPVPSGRARGGTR